MRGHSPVMRKERAATGAQGTGEGVARTVSAFTRRLRHCPERARGYKVWEEKGFISSSGVSVTAGSNTVLQET